MPTLRVSQGSSASFDVLLRDADGVAVVNAYDGSEPLVLTAHEASDDVEVPVIGSTVEWLDPAAGIFRLAIDDADTVVQGDVRLAVRIQDGGEWYDALWAVLSVVPPSGPLVPPWTLSPAYATDEQVYLAAPGDFSLIVPPSGRIASGTDGAVPETDPWILTSATEAFSGVRPGMIVQLSSAGMSRPASMAVSDAGDSVLRFRRPGFRDGEGRPPYPSGATGVRFEVLTLLPQLQAAAREFDRRFGVGGISASSSAFDSGELEGATIAYVLAASYLAATENVSNQAAQGFAAKAAWWTRRYEEAVPGVKEGLRDDVPVQSPYRTIGVARW